MRKDPLMPFLFLAAAIIIVWVIVTFH